MTLKQRTEPMLYTLASGSRLPHHPLPARIERACSPGALRIGPNAGPPAPSQPARTIRASRGAERAARGAYISRKVGAS